MNDLIESAKQRVKDAERRLETLKRNSKGDPDAIRITQEQVHQEEQRLHRLEDLEADMSTINQEQAVNLVTPS